MGSFHRLWVENYTFWGSVSNTFFRNARNEVVKIIFPGLSLETWYRDVNLRLVEYRKEYCMKLRAVIIKHVDESLTLR